MDSVSCKSFRGWPCDQLLRLNRAAALLASMSGQWNDMYTFRDRTREALSADVGSRHPHVELMESVAYQIDTVIQSRIAGGGRGQ